MATVRSSRVSRPWYTLPSTSFQSCFPEVISRGGEFCRPVRDDVEGQRAGVNRGTTDKALAVFRAQATVQKRAAKQRAYTSDGETSAGFLDGSRHHISIKTERAQLFQAQLGFVK